MAWTPFQIGVVILMVSTGSLNTITAGFQQRSLGHGVLADGSLDPTERRFDHPYLQATGMMLGECLCMVAYLIITRFIRKPTAEETRVQDEQKFNPLILWPAAFFDLIGTCLNYVGMILSTPASFQMLRGSVIVFTALLSIVLLKKRLKIYQWIGIVGIIGGLCIVGAGDLMFPKDPIPCANQTVNLVTGVYCKEEKLGSDPLLGDVIIVIGEVFHAFQFIYEEYFLTKYELAPLKVVGFEGIFGFLTIGILLWPMYFIKTGEVFGLGPSFRFEDAIDGLTEIAHGPGILGWTIANMFSIAIFNYAGVTVTKSLTSTTRAVLDNIRQIIIWGFSLLPGIEWQEFNYMTPIGFVVLISGIWLYNNVIILPLIRKLTGRGQSKPNLDSLNEETESKPKAASKGEEAGDVY